MYRTIRPILALGLLLAVSISTASFLLQKIQDTAYDIALATPSPQFPQQIEAQISEDEFLPKNSTVDTKNWKKYVDKQYDFQFLYPNNLELRVSPHYSDAGGERGITLGSKNYPTERFWMSMGVFKGYSPKELHEHLVGLPAPGEKIQTLESVINGHQVYLSKEVTGGKMNIGTITYAYAISLSNGSILWVDIQRLPVDTMDEEWKYFPIAQAIVQSIIDSQN